MPRNALTVWEPSSIGGIWHHMRYVGLWHGGANYSASSADDAEYFGSIADAVWAMRERRDSNGHRPVSFHYVFRDRASDYVPCAHDDYTGGIVLYRIGANTTPDDIREACETGYPDRMIEFGPLGGIRVERT